MGNNKFQLLLGSILLIFCACKNEIKNIEELMQYMNDPENGLVKERSIQGIKIKVKYLPIDYLVYNEMKNRDELPRQEDLDSLKKHYINSMNFLMTIGPAEEGSFDITKVGLNNYEEFSKRIMDLSFGMTDQLFIEVEGKQYKAALAQLERVYGLKQSRHVNIVFNRKKGDGGVDLLTNNFHLIYQDKIFQTGINKFYFKKEDLNKIPVFNTRGKNK